jgi:hypothetical protein
MIDEKDLEDVQEMGLDVGKRAKREKLERMLRGAIDRYCNEGLEFAMTFDSILEAEIALLNLRKMGLVKSENALVRDRNYLYLM